MARATKTTAKTTAKSKTKKAPAKAKAKAATTATAKPAARKTTKTSTQTSSKRSTKLMEPVIVVSHDIIAAKAYEIWLKKGQPAGLDDANWSEAEKELCTAA